MRKRIVFIIGTLTIHVLTNFMSTSNKLDSLESREPPLRKCSGRCRQAVGHFLVTDGEVPRLLWVESPPALVVLDSLRKQAD